MCVCVCVCVYVIITTLDGGTGEEVTYPGWQESMKNVSISGGCVFRMHHFLFLAHRGQVVRGSLL